VAAGTVFKNLLINEEFSLISLKGIPGMGYLESKKICNFIGIPLKSKIKDLDIKKLTKLNKFLKFFNKNSNFKFKERNKILFEINLKSYIGLRHFYSLPVSGQRTRSNAKTQKKLSKRRFNKN
jgi:small subunit ribosomal protein S13